MVARKILRSNTYCFNFLLKGVKLIFGLFSSPRKNKTPWFEVGKYLEFIYCSRRRSQPSWSLELVSVDNNPVYRLNNKWVGLHTKSPVLSGCTPNNYNLRELTYLMILVHIYFSSFSVDVMVKTIATYIKLASVISTGRFRILSKF